jgi:acyl-coenzyme A synthetase/AMP-(fatty) acid ligase
VAQGGPQGARVVLACEDAFDFAAGFFGLLRAGRTVVVPPNFLPDTLDRLGRDAGAVLSALPPARDPRAATLGGRVEFWTSGSTGEPKCVARDLAQLEAEVGELEAAFGHLCGDGPVIGTVPHQHIYGCLFRLLWPLAAGRPFLADPCGDPVRFLAALGHRDTTLVSSPAHLARLPRLVDLDRAPRPRAVFSSGGPLDPGDAPAWEPSGVVEIYGSTETGGIAWRRQDGTPGGLHWTPFPDVALAFGADGGLTVDCFRAGPVPVRMEDAAAPAEGGRFSLKGRLDRIVKLHEKRIALPEIEAALEAHPWVARAAVVLLDGPRPCLGAVLVLAPPAPAGAVRVLRDHLARRFEAAALPKRWRLVEDLPGDDRGKLTARALAALFGQAP